MNDTLQLRPVTINSTASTATFGSAIEAARNAAQSVPKGTFLRSLPEVIPVGQPAVRLARTLRIGQSLTGSDQRMQRTLVSVDSRRSFYAVDASNQQLAPTGVALPGRVCVQFDKVQDYTVQMLIADLELLVGSLSDNDWDLARRLCNGEA